SLELRDPATSAHAQRVTEYVLLLADELGLSADERQRLLVVAPLHDIGKLGVGDALLRKPGELTPAEAAQMKGHAPKCGQLLHAVPDLAPAAAVVRAHHERWDGRGYPDGLAGEAIPRLARLVAVADAFDTLTWETAYRPAMPPEVALAQIQHGAGSQSAPELARACRRAGPRLEHLLRHRLQLQNRPRPDRARDTVLMNPGPSEGPG